MLFGTGHGMGAGLDGPSGDATLTEKGHPDESDGEPSMLSKLNATNYRNLHLGDGVPLGSLNLFVGPNGSGKTNFVRLLRLLQDAIIGAPDERRGVTSFEDAVSQAGRGRLLDAELSTPADVFVDYSFRLQRDYDHQLFIGLRVNDDNSVLVSQELMCRWPPGSRPPDPFRYYEVSPMTGKGVVSVSGADSPVGELPPNQLVFRSLQGWLEKHIPRAARHIPFYEGRTLIADSVAQWVFYESARMSTQAIRQSNPEVGGADTVLSGSGENLVLVLSNLMRDGLEFEERLQQAMQELFPKTRRLRVVPAGRVALSLEWWYPQFQRPFFLDEMSDGTVRMLCWAAVLLASAPPSLIVLEEPETGLHPAWLRVLAGWIRDAARRTQVIVSTHSPDLLDHFTENIADVRVFASDPAEPGHTIVKSIDPEAIASKLGEGWELGDLYRVGDPGVGGWPW